MKKKYGQKKKKEILKDEESSDLSSSEPKEKRGQKNPINSKVTPLPARIINNPVNTQLMNNNQATQNYQQPAQQPQIYQQQAPLPQGYQQRPFQAQNYQQVVPQQSQPFQPNQNYQQVAPQFQVNQNQIHNTQNVQIYPQQTPQYPNMTGSGFGRNTSPQQQQFVSRPNALPSIGNQFVPNGMNIPSQPQGFHQR